MPNQLPQKSNEMPTLNLPDKSPETQKAFGDLFEWFNTNVSRIETAYGDLGKKFEKLNKELEVKNDELTEALNQNTLIQKHLNALLTSLTTGVIMVDTDRRISVMNKAAEKMLDLQANQCIGKNMDEVLLPEMGIGESLRHCLESPNEAIHEERTVFVENRQFPATFMAGLVRDADGDFLGAVETFTDISDMKELEEEIQQARVLGALGEMAATVAHEIRNPLGGIGGYAGLLARQIKPEEPNRRLVDKIIQGVSSMNKIVTNLLFYTRKVQLTLVRLNLKLWLDDIVNHVLVELEDKDSSVRLETFYQNDEILVEIDPERFQQVILNVLHNAVHAVDEEEEGLITVSLSCNEDSVIINIKDNGIGIPVEDFEQIFTPFFTTKEQGTGLGLAIVKKMVDLHRGQLDIKSTEGVGTEFIVTLKRAN